jgi:hypothetical protein
VGFVVDKLASGGGVVFFQILEFPLPIIILPTAPDDDNGAIGRMRIGKEN